jgi:hypothetical protein
LGPDRATTISGMNTADHLHDRASELVEVVRAFQAAAEQRGSYGAAPESLACLEEALQVLSAAWYQVAAGASSGLVERQRGGVSEAQVAALSREQEVRLISTLHDVAAAFGRCARMCRDGRATVTPIIARGAGVSRADDQRRSDELSWFQSRQPPPQRVA